MNKKIFNCFSIENLFFVTFTITSKMLIESVEILAVSAVREVSVPPLETRLLGPLYK